MKRLIRRTIAPEERVPLLVTIFSDGKQIEIVKHLSGDDAQKFIDTTIELSLCTLSPLKNG